MSVLLCLAVVRSVGIGLVANRLVRGARTAPRRLTENRLGRIGVEGLLLRERVRVGVLPRLADLDDVLLLAVATTAGPAPDVAAALRGLRVLVGLAAVRRISVRLVARVLLRRACACARVAADDE